MMGYGTNAEKTNPPNQKANANAMTSVNMVPNTNKIILSFRGLINTAARIVRESDPTTIAKTIHPNHPI